MNIIPKSSRRGSKHGLVDYIAHSKLDREKEGEKRQLFTDEEFAQELDVRRSNRYLSITGLKPTHDELLHLVLAPKNEEFEKIGMTQKERTENFKQVVRETLAALKKEINAKTLKWVAALHLNTDNPHVHVAIQKQFVDNGGETRELKQIPRRSMYYKEQGANGDKITQEGSLVIASKKKIEELAQQVLQQHSVEREESRQQTNKKDTAAFTRYESSDPLIGTPDYKDRRTLAEEMLVASEIAKREANIGNLEKHGDKKRFEIKDAATGRTHHVSIFDIERRIQAVAGKKAAEKYPKDNRKRDQLAKHFADKERSKNALTIKQLETTLDHILGHERRHLAKALEKHTRLRNAVLLIAKNRERAGKPALLPIFKPDELQKLQTEAIRREDLEKLRFLEAVRHKLTEERRQLNRQQTGDKSQTRRDEDVRELKAAQIISKLKTAASEQRLENWIKNKDFHRVSVDGKMLSNHDLERQERQTSKQNGFWSKIKSSASQIFVRKSDLKNSKWNYETLRQQINAELAATESAKQAGVERNKALSQTLNEIFDAETNPNKNELAPTFTSYELAEVEDLALETLDFKTYKETLKEQEKWLQLQLHGGQINNASNAIIAEFIVGRAEARNVTAQMRLAEKRENLAAFTKNKHWIKHKIVDPQSGGERELSPKETAVKKHYHLLDNLIEQAFESKERKRLRAAVDRAAQMAEQNLTLAVDDAAFVQREIAIQKRDVVTHYKPENKSAPLFTPKEIAALEYRSLKTGDKNESAKLIQIIEQAEKNGKVLRIHDALNVAAKKLKAPAPDLVNNAQPQIIRDELIQKSIFVAQNQIAAGNQNQETLSRSEKPAENPQTNLTLEQISPAKTNETSREKNQSIVRSTSKIR